MKLALATKRAPVVTLHARGHMAVPLLSSPLPSPAPPTARPAGPWQVYEKCADRKRPLLKEMTRMWAQYTTKTDLSSKWGWDKTHKQGRFKQQAVGRRE